VTGVLFGLGPALWIQRRNPGDVLKQGARSGTQSGAVRRWADSLAAAEVALALLMTTGAALLVGSTWRLANVNPGFEARGVLITGYGLYSHKYDSAQHRDAFHNELLARARRIPGVTHVAFGSTPLEPNLWRSGVVVRGRPAPPSIEPAHMYASPDWLATLGISLRRGRFFTEDDRRDPSRIVVNEAFARMFFPGEDAVGQQVSFTKERYAQTTFTIIGVIADVHETSLIAPPGPLVIDEFLAFGSPRLLIRTRGEPNAVVAPLRSILRQMDPALALTPARPLTVLRDQEMARSRFFAAVLLAFAVVGVVLAAIGIYGVLSHIARSRGREMSIRIALGADAAHVRWFVVRHGAAITAAGLLVGLGVSLASTRVLSALLFDLLPNDPVVLGGVVLVLAAASGLASFIPAWRASRADAMDALRAD
jgi:putative ABC transport system permease protein